MEYMYDDIKKTFIVKRNILLEDFNGININTELKKKYKLILFLLDLYWNLNCLFIATKWNNLKDSESLYKELRMDFNTVNTEMKEIENIPLPSEVDNYFSQLQGGFSDSMDAIRLFIVAEKELFFSMVEVKFQIFKIIASFDHTNTDMEAYKVFSSYIYSKIPTVGNLIELNKLTNEMNNIRKNKISTVNKVIEFVELYNVILYNACLNSYKQFLSLENNTISENKLLQHSKHKIRKHFSENFEKYNPNIPVS